MTLLEFKHYFKNELSEWYNDSESTFIYTLFIEKIFGFEAIHQRRFSHQELLPDGEEQLKTILSELKTGRPYQQILGETEFYSLLFSVNEHVLIPRPETEELLEFTISQISNLKSKTLNLKILDIGTGSGIIPIVLKKKFPNAEVSTIDISEKAIEVARENALKHNVEVQFIQNDYLNYTMGEKFDVIISNPPYIGIDENSEIEYSVKNFEPTIALFSPTSDALIFYRKIAQDAKQKLNDNGMVFLEINQKLGEETLDLFNDFSESQLIKDISGNDRFVFAVR